MSPMQEMRVGFEAGWKISVPVLAVAAIFTGCSTKPPPPPSAPAAAAVAHVHPASLASATTTDETARSYASGDQPAVIPPANPKGSSYVPPARDPRQEQIVSLVRNGELAESGRGVLVFAKPGKGKKEPSASLFEEAIVLNRLRSKLKSIPNLPESVCSGATIRDSGAYLRLNQNMNASTVATIIDTALATSGIRYVQVDLSRIDA